MSKNKHNIVVGVSGGVDSAVTALLLKEQGHNISGIFMRNWETENNDPHCTAEQDLSDAQAICDQIGIPLTTVNFSKEYWDNVFQHCLDEYAAGLTPNPDIWCNREIKFKVFLEHAKSSGAELLATGHYARIYQKNGQLQLLRGLDNNKDQSYFLYTLTQQQLSQSLFPLGELNKTEVRKIAAENNLINYDKKDSTGICFIGERKFKSFLSEFILAQPGHIETPAGKIIGKHDGIMFYTLGQRKGLNIGGIKGTNDEPWYVLQKDIKRNVLIVDQGHDHPLLFTKRLICKDVHWIAGKLPTKLYCSAKTRYRQHDQICQINQKNNDTLLVEFDRSQRAVTPGQSIVFYADEACLGGGIIT